MSRILSLVLVSCCLFWAPGPVRAAGPGDAPEKLYTVRYSYEAWSRAGKKRYVLVPAPAEIRAGVFKDRIRSLFEILKAAKGNTYGLTKIAFNDDAEKTAEVFVWLDPAKADYKPIMMAETVYTFTENGARKVRFPNVQDSGWTRTDVPIPAFVLTLPLPEALPPIEVAGALVAMPDGTLLPFATVSERLKSFDRATVDAMWLSVTQGPPPATLAAIEAGKLLGLPDLEARLLPVLQSANPQIRGAALGALVGHDNPTVNAAIRKIMDEDPDATIQDQAAVVLSQSKDPAFGTAAQYHALRSKDPNVVVAAAKGLGESGQPEAGTQLLAVLLRPDAPVRAAAIASLLKRRDFAALAQKLGEDKVDLGIRLEIAAALAEGPDADTRLAGLAFLAVQGKGGASADAAAALGKLDLPPAYEALGKALGHAEATTRIAAAGALAKLGQLKALPLLAKAKVDDPDSGPATLDAIRKIYAGQKSEVVLKSCRESDLVLRRMAVATLGELVKKSSRLERKQILEVLRVLATDNRAEIRASAARSFGDMGGDDVRPDLLKLGTDPAIEVQRASAASLGGVSGKESVKLLLGFAQQPDRGAKPDLELLANALTSLGQLQEREALDPVVTRLDHEDLRVRRAATGALVRIGQTLNPEKRNPMLQYFSERLFDKDTEVRMKALEGLTLVKDPRVVTAMAALLQDPVMEVRKTTLLSMAATSDVSAVEGIASGLDDDHPEVRKAALEAFRRLKRKEAVSVLTAYIKKEKDKALADEAGKLVQALKGG